MATERQSQERAFQVRSTAGVRAVLAGRVGELKIFKELLLFNTYTNE